MKPGLLLGKRARLIATTLACLWMITGCGKRAEGPNLLLVCIDTLRADLFLHPDVDDSLSPWLDRAQVYENAMTVAPWTLPTVATVLTGLYPVQHGAGAFENPMHNLDVDPPTSLTEDAVTLAETLSRQGWRTGVFSAHPWVRHTFGLEQGFDENLSVGSEAALTDQMFEWARKDDHAFFAYLHLMAPHDQHRLPEAEVRALLDGLDEKKKAFIDNHRMTSVCRDKPSMRCKRSQAYQAAVLEARETLAAILQNLEDGGDLENTVVVLYSDHGEAFRERRTQHESLQIDPRGMYGTGHGQYQFEELLRIPLLAWVPGQAGQAHPQPVSLVDLYPTLLYWLGANVPTGIPLAGELLPPDGEALGNRTLYASNIAYGPETIAVVSGQYKAMIWPEQEKILVFDLAADPDELNPLPGDSPVIAELAALAAQYQALPGQYAGAAPTPGQQQLEDLKAIGYLQGVEPNEPNGGDNPDDTADEAEDKDEP